MIRAVMAALGLTVGTAVPLGARADDAEDAGGMDVLSE